MIEKLDTNIQILDIDEEENYGKFALYPLERGYGTTIGNSMRRVLLSSLPGSSVSKILIDGVLHEFSIIDGVVEDVPEIILNINGLIFLKWFLPETLAKLTNRKTWSGTLPHLLSLIKHRLSGQGSDILCADVSIASVIRTWFIGG